MKFVDLALKYKGEVKTYEEAAKKIDEVIDNGHALELLRQFIGVKWRRRRSSEQL